MDAIISELFEEVAYCQALEAVAVASTEAEAALIRSPWTATATASRDWNEARFSFNSAVLQLPRSKRQFLVSIDG